MSTLKRVPLLCMLALSCSEHHKAPAAPNELSLVPATILFEDFDRDLQEGIFYKWGGGDATANQFAAEASDQRAVHLILPKGQAAGPTRGPNLEIRAEPFLYGTFEARLKTPRCSTQNEGNVSGFFTYFHDGSDHDADGLADNSEIDFEWLCAEPESIYLTMWTDYDDATGGQERVIRKINLARGIIEYTRFAKGWGAANTESLAGLEAQPEAIPPLDDYDASKRFYEYGFTWTEHSVVWWMRDNRSQEKIILWNYQGRRISQRPARLLVNTWHSSSWAPEDTPDALKTPQTDLLMEVDWIRIQRP